MPCTPSRVLLGLNVLWWLIMSWVWLPARLLASKGKVEYSSQFLHQNRTWIHYREHTYMGLSEIKLPFICLQVSLEAEISRLFKEREYWPAHITKQNRKISSELVYSTRAATTERAHQLTIALYVVNKEKVFE
jgi:hypothetical protein